MVEKAINECIPLVRAKQDQLSSVSPLEGKLHGDLLLHLIWNALTCLHTEQEAIFAMSLRVTAQMTHQNVLQTGHSNNQHTGQADDPETSQANGPETGQANNPETSQANGPETG